MLLRRVLLVTALGLLGACNMVMSKTPVFTEADRGKIAPRDGIWIGEEEDCKFDPKPPESQWPSCALWVVVRHSGQELHLSDGKGETQRVASLFVGGTPMIVEGQWTDDAKAPAEVTYGYYALEPQGADPAGGFSSALAWPVECGTQSGSEIRPFPGITPECRPTSKDAIRAAARLSRRTEQIKSWRWLRPERP